jgi:hypothetical protein
MFLMFKALFDINVTEANAIKALLTFNLKKEKDDNILKKNKIKTQKSECKIVE